MKNLTRKYLLPHLSLFILRLLWWSWRVTLVEPDEMKDLLKTNKPFLMSHWHGDELALLHLVKHYRIATMTSTSKDGELMNWIIHKLGGATSRGSSTRGGATALRGLIKLLRSGGHNSSMAVDGPRGPIYKVKPGVFEISRLANAPIFWVGVSADRYYTFSRAWNKAILPKPFSRVFIQWYGPLPPVGQDQDPKASDLSSDLESKLNAAKHQASKQFRVGQSGPNNKLDKLEH